MNRKKEIILLNVSGEDKPGLTSSLTQILSQYQVNILDIGQAVIHNTLSLGILIELPPEAESSPILKDLLFKAYELNIRIRFSPIPEDDYQEWVNSQGKERYIITLLGRKLRAEQIARVSDEIYRQGLNIDFISRLSGRIPLAMEQPLSRSCVELSVRGRPADLHQMKANFLMMSQEYGMDIAFQVDNVYRRNRRLVCFDMDSTLIQAEVIVELAKAAGVGQQVHEITEAAMRGEIDFKESFKRRLSLLKGLDESVLKGIAETIPITEGAQRLISTLKKFGYKIAILSGGFTYFGNHLKSLMPIDYVYANELEIVDGKLTGRHLGDIVDGTRKADLLKLIAQVEGIQLDQVIAVGDGANDLPMINLAGLGIAFHAKPVVKENASHAISTLGLDGILYLLGFRDRDLEI